MSALNYMRTVNKRLCDLLKILLVSIFLLLVLVVLWGVASRYLLGNQASWSEELARLLMVWLALLGAALVCREEGHLGLDVLARLWTDDVKRLGQLFVCGLILLFASVVMGWGGWHLVSERFESGQTLPALSIAKAWFYMALPVSGVLISFFSIESMWALFVGQAMKSKEGVR